MRQVFFIRRSNSGSMLALAVAVLAGIVILLLVFLFNYTRLFRGQQSQDSAIQAAALAAAQDISRIVYNSPEFGYVSLSDDAPIGKSTTAGDQFYLPVHSLNTLIATARLDYIIGDKLGADGSIMKQLALQDLNLVKSNVIPTLEKILDASLKTGGTAQDLDGNTIKPYDDALTAFTTNLKKMGGGSNCTYVANTFKLSLGCLQEGQGIATNVPVPQPASLAPVSGNQQQSDCYLSETNVLYANSGAKFYFASVGPSIRLVDQSKFTSSPSAGQIPAIVKAEADQKIVNSQNQNGLTIHAIACAQPANVYDTKPAPGALSISLPDGQPSVLSKPHDILIAMKQKATLMSPQNGDFPTDATPPGNAVMTPMTWMLAGKPNIDDVWNAAIYDWVKRAGAKAQIDQVLGFYGNMFPLAALPAPAFKDWKTQTALGGPIIDMTSIVLGSPKIPVGVMHVYKFNQSGKIQYTNKVINPFPIEVCSERQMYGEAIDALDCDTVNGVKAKPKFDPITSLEIKGYTYKNGSIQLESKFDCYIRDEVRQAGTVSGGKHGGEPLNNPQVAAHPRLIRNNICLDSTHGVAAFADAGGSGLGAISPQTGGGGAGSLPILSGQSDFAETMLGLLPVPTMYDTFNTGPSGGTVRPTYTTNGTAVDITFRRQIKVDKNISLYYSIGDIGYFAQEF